jgi:hypothetical protein
MHTARWSLMALIVFGLLSASCGKAASIGAATRNVTATPTVFLDCSTFTAQPDAKIADNIPVPPHTLIGTLGVASGTAYTPLCTPNATQTSIENEMRTLLTNDGWQAYNGDKPNCATNMPWIKAENNNYILAEIDFGAYTNAGVNNGPPRWGIMTATCPK